MHDDMTHWSEIHSKQYNHNKLSFYLFIIIAGAINGIWRAAAHSDYKCVAPVFCTQVSRR